MGSRGRAKCHRVHLELLGRTRAFLGFVRVRVGSLGWARGDRVHSRSHWFTPAYLGWVRNIRVRVGSLDRD